MGLPLISAALQNVVHLKDLTIILQTINYTNYINVKVASSSKNLRIYVINVGIN